MAIEARSQDGALVPAEVVYEERHGPEAVPELVLRLGREAYRFDFFQAVHLLERHFPKSPSPGTTSDLGREAIRFRPDSALVFPATDLRRIEFDERGRVSVTATFMGLYGVDSPLPSFFGETANLENPDAARLRDFLDIFSHRFYAFFYRAWRKCRIDLSDSVSTIAASVAGIGTPRALEASAASVPDMMSLAGRLAMRVRTADGLRALLDRSLRMPVGVEENVERRVEIRERPALGGGFSLGRAATVGQRILDRAGKFRIHLGPLDLDTYLDLLPGKAAAEAVRWLTRAYAPDYLAFDVALHVRAETLRPARLGDASCLLGMSTCLGRPSSATLVRIVNYE